MGGMTTPTKPPPPDARPQSGAAVVRLTPRGSADSIALGDDAVLALARFAEAPASTWPWRVEPVAALADGRSGWSASSHGAYMTWAPSLGVLAQRVLDRFAPQEPVEESHPLLGRTARVRREAEAAAAEKAAGAARSTPWGEMPYDARTPRDVVDDYVLTRGDLSEAYAREQLAVWIERFADARAADAEARARAAVEQMDAMVVAARARDAADDQQAALLAEPAPGVCRAVLAKGSRGVYGPAEDMSCKEVAGHDGPHRDGPAVWSDDLEVPDLDARCEARKALGQRCVLVNGHLPPHYAGLSGYFRTEPGPELAPAWVADQQARQGDAARSAAEAGLTADGQLLYEPDGSVAAMASSSSWAELLAQHSAAAAGLRFLFAHHDATLDALCDGVDRYRLPADQRAALEALLKGHRP